MRWACNGLTLEKTFWLGEPGGKGALPENVRNRWGLTFNIYGVPPTIFLTTQSGSVTAPLPSGKHTHTPGSYAYTQASSLRATAFVVLDHSRK